MNHTLYKLFSKPFIKHYQAEQRKPVGFDDLEFAFELGGKKFYRFSEQTSMPISRMTQLEIRIMHKFTGLLGKELDLIVEGIETNQMKAVECWGKRDEFIKYNSRITGLTNELKFRNKRIIHDQILYEILAISYVREDENPAKYDNQVQQEKVVLFQEESYSETKFFFQLPEVRDWLRLLQLSEDNWIVYLNDSRLVRKSLEIILNHCLPKDESSNSEKDAKAS